MADFDVVIVGSGAGGGASAWALARRGIKVLVLEAGPSYDYTSDYRLDRPDWETTRFPDKTDAAATYTVAPLQPLDGRWRDLLSWNRNTGRFVRREERLAQGYLHVRGVGGSTLHFTGEAHRLHPRAMTMRSRFGVAADWPLDYAELEPYYVEAERVVGVAGANDDPVRVRSADYPLPPHRLSYASQKVAAGFRKLGLGFTANPVATLSRPYDGRPACNYCAQCHRGCPRADKGSVDVTFIAKALASGHCTVRAGAEVVRVEAGPGDAVSGVDYVDHKGKEARVTGRAVIVACGAVQTPRLLLISENRHAPDGLANESGQVGRNFMETLSWVSSGLHDEPLGSHRGLPSDGICWDFNAPDAIPGLVGGCRIATSTASADLTGPINYATRVVAGWGLEHKAAMKRTMGRVLSIGAMGESLPNPRSFIDLDAERGDSHGQPLARIHSHLGDTEIRRLAFMAKMCREVVGAAGAGDIFEEFGTYDLFSSTHVFGTCRMGHDAAQSVVDAWCRSHRWRNLFVVDASVFPSSGGGEAPSLTIEALAIRTADHLAGLLGRGEI